MSGSLGSGPSQVCFSVEEGDENLRLDAFLVKHVDGISRSKLQRAVAKGAAKVDGVVSKSSLRVHCGQQIEFVLPEPQSDAQVPEDIPLDILFEDEHLVAINKPANMVVHPAKGHWSGTLTAALAFHFKNLSQIGGPTRPGIVHRLDRDTTGVILVAKTDEAHVKMAAQFEKRSVQKEYFAIVSPGPDRDRDLIDKPIGAHPYQREKKAIRENHSTSRQASSFYEVVTRFRGFGILNVKPKTGRTHQIRVHLAHAGCPVLCDKLYSGRSRLTVGDLHRQSTNEESDVVLLDRQALHAQRIEFDHPATGQRQSISAEIPSDLKRVIDNLATLRPNI